MSILYYFIDEETRKLRPEAAHKVVAQKDHNADVIRVGIPETMDSVDLETSAVRCMYQRPKETEVRSKTATYYDTSGGYLWYDWTLQEGDTAKAGKINFTVCLQHIEGGLLTVDWNTTIGEIYVKTSYHSDDSDEADETITPTVAQRVAVLESVVQGMVVGMLPADSALDGQIPTADGDGGWEWETPDFIRATDDQGQTITIPEIDDTTTSADDVWSSQKTSTEISTKYTKPATGIPASDLALGVIPDVSGFYTKPSGGIPVSDLAAGIVTVTETISGTDVTINGVDNHRYICGEVSTISITPPVSGIIDVVFTSGATATVLTAPNTVKWPPLFNPAALEVSSTYEINISDGLAVVALW